jgi:hypothetical protein
MLAKSTRSRFLVGRGRTSLSLSLSLSRNGHASNLTRS